MGTTIPFFYLRRNTVKYGSAVKGNEIALIDILKAPEEDIVELIQLNMEKKKIYSYIHILDQREQQVITARFGLVQQKERTQREITKELSISRSYVSRIEKRALLKLFHEFYRNRG